MSDLFDVSAKTALVTGGSRGIGLMIARGLVQAGAKVIVSSRKSDDVQAAARELGQLGDCHAIPADVSTPEGAAELARAAASPAATSAQLPIDYTPGGHAGCVELTEKSLTPAC